MIVVIRAGEKEEGREESSGRHEDLLGHWGQWGHREGNSEGACKSWYVYFFDFFSFSDLGRIFTIHGSISSFIFIYFILFISGNHVVLACFDAGNGEHTAQTIGIPFFSFPPFFFSPFPL